MKLGVAIMSAYLKGPRPDRRAWAEHTRDLLGDYCVHLETRPAPLRATSRRCWQALVDQPDLTHGIVMQDDIILCEDFGAEATRAMAVHPDDVFAPWYTRSIDKLPHGMPGFVKTVGGLWAPAMGAPLNLVREYLRWERAYVLPSYPWDDIVWQMFLVFTKRWAWAALPSLIDHPPPNSERAFLKGSLGHAVPYDTTAFKSDPSPIEWEAQRHNFFVDRTISFGGPAHDEIMRLVGIFGRPEEWSAAKLGLSGS